jgi:hypothetical protein
VILDPTLAIMMYKKNMHRLFLIRKGISSYGLSHLLFPIYFWTNLIRIYFGWSEVYLKRLNTKKGGGVYA